MVIFISINIFRVIPEALATNNLSSSQDAFSCGQILLCSAQSYGPSTLLLPNSAFAHAAQERLCFYPGCNSTPPVVTNTMGDSQLVFKFPATLMGGESPEKSHFQRLFLSASPRWELIKQIPKCLG